MFVFTVFETGLYRKNPAHAVQDYTYDDRRSEQAQCWFWGTKGLWWYINLLGLSLQNTTDWVAQIIEFYFLSFWRLELQDQGVSNFGFSWGYFPWLADGHFLAVPTYGPLLVCVVCVLTCYKEITHIGLGPIDMISFYLNYLFNYL